MSYGNWASAGDASYGHHRTSIDPALFRSKYIARFSLGGCFTIPQETYFTELEREYCDGIIAGFLLPNDDATCDTTAPTGNVLIYDASARVKKSSISSRMFQYTCMYKILRMEGSDSNLTDNDFTSKMETLNRQIPQFAPVQEITDNVSGKRMVESMRPSISVQRDPNVLGEDGKEWVPELGSRGFVGIFSVRLPDSRYNDYYLIASGGAEAASMEFQTNFVKNPLRITWGDFVNHPQVRFLERLALRNVDRIAYEAARAFNVVIPNVEDSDVLRQADCSARPRKGVPFMCQPRNYFKKIKWGIGQDAVAQFNEAVDSRDIRGQLLVNINPSEGIIGFNGNPSRPAYGYDYGSYDSGAVGMPVSLGRRAPRANVDINMIPGESMKSFKKFLTWEGKTPKSLDMTSYNSLSNGCFKGRLKELGWCEQWGCIKYLPIAVKISGGKFPPSSGCIERKTMRGGGCCLDTLSRRALEEQEAEKLLRMDRSGQLQQQRRRTSEERRAAPRQTVRQVSSGRGRQPRSPGTTTQTRGGGRQTRTQGQGAGSV